MCWKQHQNKYYLQLFILGENNLDSDIKESYQFNGISHLFAVSGMHISLFTSFLQNLLNRIIKNKKFNFVIIFIFLCFYMFLVNYTASVVRASLFFIIISIKKIFKLKISNMELIILLMITLLIYNPFYIYNIGFLYSFIISIALIYFKDVFTTDSYLKKLFKISFIAFLVSIPININNNFEINLITPFINLIFVPFVSFIIL